MDYTKRNKTRVYHSKFYRQHSEKGSYSWKSRKMMTAIMLVIMIALLVLTIEILKSHRI